MAVRAINVRAKGQMTLPSDIRREMGVEDGGVIYIVERGDERVLVKADAVVDRTAGIFRKYAEGKPALTPEEVHRIAGESIADEGANTLREIAEESIG